MDKIIIEARINEYQMRDVNPNVPWSVDEIVENAVAARNAGAAILHFHARCEDGSPDNTPETYARIIRAVRKETDILILPTLGFNSNDKSGKERFKIISRISENPETRPDLIPLDTGSVNLERYDEKNKRFENQDSVYMNPTDVLIYSAKEAMKYGIKAKMTCWDMGFVRRGRIMVEQGLISSPGYFLFHLTEGHMITGHPCTKIGVDSLRSVLPENSIWSVNCVGGNLFKVIPYVVANGGNVAIGIGDYHYKEFGCPTNEELVRKVVDIARDAGREPATPKEVRMLLGM